MPTCSIRPWLSTTTRSASSSASSWSWVTKTVVWPVLVVDLAQPAAQLRAHLGVERAERLVEQQDARLDGERAGERHALALAAGELGRIALLEAGELDEVEQLHARASRISALRRPRRAPGRAVRPKAMLSNTVMCRNSA